MLWRTGAFNISALRNNYENKISALHNNKICNIIKFCLQLAKIFLEINCSIYEKLVEDGLAEYVLNL